MSEPKASEGKPPAPAKEKVERGSTRRPKNRGVGKSPGNKYSKNTQGKANLVRPKRLTLLQKVLNYKYTDSGFLWKNHHWLIFLNSFIWSRLAALTKWNRSWEEHHITMCPLHRSTELFRNRSTESCTLIMNPRWQYKLTLNLDLVLRGLIFARIPGIIRLQLTAFDRFFPLDRTLSFWRRSLNFWLL